MKSIRKLENAIKTKGSIFWDVKPCNPLKVNRRFGGNMACPSSRSKNKRNKKPVWKQVATLKVETACSSETSVDFQRTTWRYIPEDRTIHNNWCENLKNVIKMCRIEIWHDDL
jgi:hypothetical protein